MLVNNVNCTINMFQFSISILLSFTSFTMKYAVVSTEGVNFSRGFTLKELAIWLPGDETSRYYVFQPPVGQRLSEGDHRTERYAVKVLGATSTRQHVSGSLPYHTHIGVLYSLADFTIYVAGHVSYKFLTQLLPYTNVIDIQEISGHRFPTELPSSWCGLNHNPRYCALSKLWNMRAHIDRYLHRE